MQLELFSFSVYTGKKHIGKEGDFMQNLSMKHRCIIGFTLFSMFFGAGNLIFPPLLGAQAGRDTLIAMAGLGLTAVLLPVLSVMAVARHDGLTNLVGSIHPVLAILFAVFVHLMIGPCVAIPRTASTSFEMAVAPFLHNSDQTLFLIRCVYSFVFFTVAIVIALKPTHLKDRLGKIMTPVLLVLSAVTFFGVLVKLPALFAAPNAYYAGHPIRSGFITGYQTMDILAAYNFGTVISMNIGSFGITDKKAVASETIRAGIMAGVMLIIVYGATSYIGAVCSVDFPGAQNGAEILTWAVKACYGIYGQLIIGAIFFIACFNVCVGLLCCCATFFHELLPKISYVAWLIIFAVSSFVISSAGLNFILTMSLPVLQIMCPVAILITVYGLIRKP